MKIWLKIYKKTEGENKRLTKDINIMRAVVNKNQNQNYRRSKEPNGSYGGR